jgi:hypothetical protein
MRDHTPNARRTAHRPVRSTGRPVRPSPRGDAGVREWETARWKHQVEAEARHRLKKELRGESVD